MFGLNNYRILVPGCVLLGVLFLPVLGCSKKSSGSDNKSNAEVASATGEANVGSATAEADVAGATGEVAGATGEAGIKDATAEDTLKKKEVIFRVPVATERLVRGEMKAYLSAAGTLAPEDQILVKAEITGKITLSSAWEEGQVVKAGQVLATIDNEDVQYMKEEAQKNLRLSQERLPPALEKYKLAERNLASKKRLFDEGVIAQLDYDQAEVGLMDAEIAYKQAQADVDTRRTELEKVRYKQDRAVVASPFDGQLVRKEYLEPQQNLTASYPILSLDHRTVSAGQSLFGIIKTSRMRIDVDVSSKEIVQVRPGQPVEIHVYSGEIFEVTGVVSRISTALDPVTRFFKVTVLMDNLEGQLRSGMFCKVDIVVEHRYDAIVIAKEIVQTRNNRKVAFVVSGEKDKEEAEQREIQLGISNRFDVEITEGLHEGDVLIVRGYETLKNKTKVKLTQADEDQAEESDEDLSGRQAGS